MLVMRGRLKVANVFISHRTVDLPDATRLATDLRSLGHIVWLDDWELSVGDSIVGMIDAGLDNADVLVMCLSPHGVGSRWMSREWQSSLARQLNGDPIKVLPALLPGGKLPAIMGDIKYADLASDWSSGLAALCRGIP